MGFVARGQIDCEIYVLVNGRGTEWQKVTILVIFAKWIDRREWYQYEIMNSRGFSSTQEKKYYDSRANYINRSSIIIMMT